MAILVAESGDDKGQLAYLAETVFHDTLQPGRKALCGARAAFEDDASNL